MKKEVAAPSWRAAVWEVKKEPCQIALADLTGFSLKIKVVTEMTIHGHNGWLIEKTDVIWKEEMIMYFWLDLAGRYSFLYSSLGISPKKAKRFFMEL